MNDQISRSDRKSRWVSGLQLVRNRFPRPANAALAAISGCFLVLSFPDANLWWLAWIALIPVLVAASREQRIVAAFALGWICGTIFFYGSCYWLTYSMIRYGGIPPLMAYL